MQAETAALAVRPTLGEYCSLESHTRRAADLNHLSVRDVLGRRPRVSVWEDPPIETLSRISGFTGTPVRHLRAATLVTKYPGAFSGGRRLGRRWRASGAHCPHCGPTYDVELRIQVLVTCVRCGRLLTDINGYVEPDADPHLAQQQDELRAVLRRPTAASRKRLGRLERLMFALGHALEREWPPLSAGELESRREVAVREERADVAHRSPATMAVLFGICWPRSRSATAARELEVSVRARAGGWGVGAPLSLSPQPSVEHVHEQLLAMLSQSHLGPENVPHAYTMDVQGILPPRPEIPARRAHCVVLVNELHRLSAQGWSPMAEAARYLGAAGSNGNDVVQLAGLIRRNPAGLSATMTVARDIVADGRVDYASLRAELHRQTDIPRFLERQLPEPARSIHEAGRHAAAWIWLDATRGVPSGGPHPNLSQASLRQFDQLLGPDGRLILREHWMEQVGQVAELVDNVGTPMAPAESAERLA